MSAPSAPSAQRRGRRRRRQWREGGSTTSRWDVEMLGWAVCALGAGVLGARVAPAVFPVETAAGASQVSIWLSFAVVIVLALRRSRPRGLLRFRTIDLVVSIAFGIAVRLTQGFVAGVGGAPAPWPTTFSVDGSLPGSFVEDALAGSLVSPLLEEGFFRGVVLVCAYAALRRRVGGAAAGVAAVSLSTALFVLAHCFTATLDLADAVSLTLLGVVAGALVMGTGRIWAAVGTHVVFNATGFLLLAVGTLLA